jgi:hypothetical protein
LGTTIKRSVGHLLSRSEMREAEHFARETLQIAEYVRDGLCTRTSVGLAILFVTAQSV